MLLPAQHLTRPRARTRQRCTARLATSLASGALLLLLSGEAFALRPFDGTDADVAERHVVEIEAGPLGYLRNGSDHSLSGPAIVLNYGAFEDFEAVAQGQIERTLDSAAAEDRTSVTGLSLSLKQVWRKGSLQGGTGPSLAAEYAVLLPDIHGDKGTGASLSGIASQKWDALSVHLNTVVELTRTHHRDLFGGLIFEGPEPWTVRPVAEVFIEREAGEPTTYSGLVGALWSVSETFQLDAGVRFADENRQQVREVRAGFTWSFKTGK